MKKTIEDLTQELVRINTTNGRTIEAAVHYGEFLEEHGIDFKINEYSDGKANLETRIGPNQGKAIVVSGHLDVVPVGDINSWTHHPFSGKIIDGELWGRGSVDMKGGAALLAGVLIELLKHEDDLTHQIRLAITAEEEIGLLGAQEFAKGDIMDNATHLLITEPTDLGVAIMEKGIIWAEVKALGKQAHASRPDLGRNAIEGLVALLPSLHGLLPDNYLEEVGKSTLNIGTISGGSAANVVAETAQMICDFRLTPGVDNGKIISSIENLIEDRKEESLKFDLNVISSAPAIISSDKSLGEKLAGYTSKYTGKKPELGGMYYATDAAALLEGREASFAIYGPGSTELLHQTNERLDLEQLDMARKVIFDTILEINSEIE